MDSGHSWGIPGGFLILRDWERSMPNTEQVAPPVQTLLKQVTGLLHDMLRAGVRDARREVMAYRRTRAHFERLRVAGVEIMGQGVNALFRPYYLPPLEPRLSPYETIPDWEWKNLQNCLVQFACYLRRKLCEQPNADVVLSATANQSPE
jgi:hypothetical protein